MLGIKASLHADANGFAVDVAATPPTTVIAKEEDDVDCGTTDNTGEGVVADGILVVAGLLLLLATAPISMLLVGWGEDRDGGGAS